MLWCDPFGLTKKSHSVNVLFQGISSLKGVTCCVFGIGGASGWKAFGVQLCVCDECGRLLVNGALTSRVTSLITSLTFSQMSFLCD